MRIERKRYVVMRKNRTEVWCGLAKNFSFRPISGIKDVSVKTYRSTGKRNAFHDLISRSALLRGETEPEITTGSDSELAEQFEWRRWVDKIKRAPAVDKEEKS